jgi:CheY-like chemotaxis protein
MMDLVRILVIEDDEFWQDIVSKTLRRGLGEGLQIDVEFDYNDGMKAIQNANYDLISIDLELPRNIEELSKTDLPGMTLLKEIRKNPRSVSSGLLVLSGHRTAERVREALRNYKVYDFFDKFSFEAEQDDYVYAAKAAIRGAFLEQAALRQDNSYKFSVSYDQDYFLQGELSGPGHRASYKVKSPLPVAFTDLARRADALNDTLYTGKLGQWRAEARSIGETFYKALVDHIPLLEGITAARSLTSKHPSSLFLQFCGPPEGLSFPFELMRTENEYLVIEHIITRRIDGKPRFLRGAEPFFRLIESLVKTDGTLRVLVVGTDSSGSIPASEEESIYLARSIQDILSLLGISHYVNWLVGKDATCEHVKRELQNGYHLFHYAGHADHDSSLPENSSVTLYDGVLTASDLKVAVRETDLRLVFLSSCLGAKNSLHGGHGDFAGFLDALSQAGVPIAIGYRWEVVDDSAQRLASDFYRSLFREFCPGMALLRARQSCTVASSHKRDDATWAAPVLLMDT